MQIWRCTDFENTRRRQVVVGDKTEADGMENRKMDRRPNATEDR